MKIEGYIYRLIVLWMVLLSPFTFHLSLSFAQDYARLGERSILGTARYVGMSGAMSAIGGDPSSAHDNPAGLGLYRRSEVLLSVDWGNDHMRQESLHEWQNTVQLSQASVVISLPTSQTKKVMFNNLLFSYRRLHSYNRNFNAAGTNGVSLGVLLYAMNVPMDIDYCAMPTNSSHQMRLSELGYVNEYALDWAINIADSWYVGAGLQIQSYNLSADASYREYFNSSAYNLNKTSLLYSGVSASLSAGLVYRPFEWLRLGFGIQTNSMGSMHIYSTGTLSSLTDSVRFSYAPDVTTHENSVPIQPLHTSTSVAFQIGAYGMVALQYDYFHQPKEIDKHSLRAGIEVIPVLGFYINAGYACESTFKQDRPVSMDPTFNRQDTYFQMPRLAHYGSLALGYRGKHMIAQMAYQYRRQHFNLYAHEFVAPYNMCSDTHRLVFTLGWHGY